MGCLSTWTFLLFLLEITGTFSQGLFGHNSCECYLNQHISYLFVNPELLRMQSSGTSLLMVEAERFQKDIDSWPLET